MTRKTYNGYPSWSVWNVALWIGNDEGLYNMARDCIRHSRNRKAAARAFLEIMKETEAPECCRDQPKTPDGANYTVSSIMYAMRGL